MDECVDL